jgi:hypothetical protein
MDRFIQGFKLTGHNCADYRPGRVAHISRRTSARNLIFAR